jgi:D-beta-D-heptose 7-phosphate kinase/D-beta-D-heptose 1-phosphate adenosyltransferase
MTAEAAAEWRHTVRGALVFTNGVFDLLHPGHVDVLDRARREGSALVVGVNSDASVKRLKGPERPIRTSAERAIVLAGLEAVDAVVVFDQDTPFHLVQVIAPDVIVKGGDYSPETIVGADLVTARGGRVVVIPLVEGHSTTSTIEKLRG